MNTNFPPGFVADLADAYAKARSEIATLRPDSREYERFNGALVAYRVVASLIVCHGGPEHPKCPVYPDLLTYKPQRDLTGN